MGLLSTTLSFIHSKTYSKFLSYARQWYLSDYHPVVVSVSQSSGRDKQYKDTDTIISDQEKRYYGRIRVMSSKMTQRAKGMQRGLSEEVSLELPSKDEDPAK